MKHFCYLCRTRDFFVCFYVAKTNLLFNFFAIFFKQFLLQLFHIFDMHLCIDTFSEQSAMAAVAAHDGEATQVLLDLFCRGEGTDGVSQEQSSHATTAGSPGCGKYRCGFALSGSGLLQLCALHEICKF